jgi:hypothetical protein
MEWAKLSDAEKKIQIALENDDALAGALKAIVSTL